MLLRHIKNSQELILLASLSAGAGFVARLIPSLYVPLVLLRVGILSYSFIILYRAEGQKELAILLGTALSLGWLGSNLDLLEVAVRYDMETLATRATLLLGFGALGTVLFYQFKGFHR